MVGIAKEWYGSFEKTFKPSRENSVFLTSSKSKANSVIRLLKMGPGVNFINCFGPYTDLSHLVLNFYTIKKLLKVGRRA